MVLDFLEYAFAKGNSGFTAKEIGDLLNEKGHLTKEESEVFATEELLHGYSLRLAEKNVKVCRYHLTCSEHCTEHGYGEYKDTKGDEVIVLKSKSIFEWLGYVEFLEATKSSKEAKVISIIAIIISGLLALASMIVPFFSF